MILPLSILSFERDQINPWRWHDEMELFFDGVPPMEPFEIVTDLLSHQWYTIIPGEMRTYPGIFKRGVVWLQDDICNTIYADKRFDALRTYISNDQIAKISFKTESEATLFKLLF